MEQTREIRYSFYKDTNKDTIERDFDSLGDLLDYLAEDDEDSETLKRVKKWVKGQKKRQQ